MRNQSTIGAETLAIAPILAILYCLCFTNLFLRSNFGIMAPDLARELALEPAVLSAVASAYFLAYAVMQVPTGMLLDRYGARRTVAAMLLFAAAGTAMFAAGSSASTLVLARLLMGIGCAGVFTGAFFVLTRWLPPDRVVTQVGGLNSFGSVGALCATTPFAALIAWIGWRQSYWLFTALVLGLMLAVAAFLRDTPSGAAAAPARREGFGAALSGVIEACRQPGIPRLLVAGVPMSGAGTISGVWGAPYLKDVHALDDLGRGNVLLAMALCAIAGHALHGYLARRLNTLKGMILGASAIIFMATALLALVPRPPVALVIALFCLIGLTAAYPAVAHTQARGLVPPHLVGRGVALSNMGIMMAVSIMQLVFGWIVGTFVSAAEPPPEHAFRAAFAVQAAVTLLAVVIYAPIQDVKPRDEG